MPVPSIDHETSGPQTLDEIREWHRDVANALRGPARIRSTCNRGCFECRPPIYRNDGGGRRHLVRRPTARAGSTYNAQSRRKHEATIKVDYFRRVGQRLKDPLARAYRAWHKGLSGTKQLHPDFDEGGILTVLKQSNLVDNNIVGRYRECLRLRHWIAHGRLWTRPVEVERLDPDDVYDRAGALLRAMPD